MGRLTGILLGFFQRSKVFVQSPTSSFLLPTAALMFKQGQDRTFQTSQAAEIEVTEQRRLIAKKDRELECSRRELEDAQGVFFWLFFCGVMLGGGGEGGAGETV